jgi:translocation and assembly module TamB
VTDGRVSVRPSDDTLRLETAGINLSAAGNLLDQSAILDLEIARVLFTSAGVHPQPARIVLKARLEGDTLALPAIEVTSGQTALRISGSAGGLYTTPVVDTIVSIRSQLDELKTAFDVGGNHSGPVNAELTLKGRAANPDAGFILSLDGGRIAGQPVDRVDISINLQDRQIGIDTAAVRLAGGAITLNGTADLRGAFPDGFLSPPADTDAIAYTLAVVQDIPDLNPWLKAYSDISGKATGRLSLAGNGIRPAGISARLTLNGSGRDLIAPGVDRPVDAAVSLSARVDRETISISRLDASASGVNVSGTGRLQMNDGLLDGSLSVTADDFSRALAVAGVTSVTGAGNAALTVGGSLSRPQFALTLDSKNLAIDAFSIGDLALAADMDHAGMLDLHTLLLQNQGSRVEGNGRLRLLPDSGGIDPAYQNRLNLFFENLSAATFMDRPPMDGTFNGRLEASGPLESLGGKLFLNGSGLAVDAATIGDVDASMRLEDGTVFLDRFHLRNHDSSITATGSIQLLAPNSLSLVQDPLFDFTVASGRFDPGDFIDGPAAFSPLRARSPAALRILPATQPLRAGESTWRVSPSKAFR